MSISYQLVQKLNKYATDNSVSIDENGNFPSTSFTWSRYEQTYPILETLKHRIAPRLAELGIYFFVVGNRSGFGDAPGEEIGNAFEKYASEVDLRGGEDYLDLPVILGYVNVDPETNELEEPEVRFTLHTGIADNPPLKKAFLKIINEELPKGAFIWNGTDKQSMLVKLE